MSEFITNALGAACGVMGWSAQDFWTSTPIDFLNAWHGFEIFHGLKSAQTLSSDDVLELRNLLNQSEKQQFEKYKHGV